MNSIEKQLVRTILEELRQIKLGKEKIRDLKTAKVDLQEAFRYNQRLEQEGPAVSPAEIRDLDVAKYGGIDYAFLSESELAALEAKVDANIGAAMRKIHAQYETAKGRAIKCRARYAIAKLHNKGLSVDQMEVAIRNPGKKFTLPNEVPRAVRLVRYQPVIRTLKK